jgi:hypothetical protein
VSRDLLSVAQPDALAAPRLRSLAARYAWPLALAVAVGAAILRIWAALRIPVPWIMPDELIYRDLATSLAREGRFLVRDQSIGLVSLYPVLLAPVWRAGSVSLSLDLSKVLNVVAMTATSLLVFAWARRLVAPRYAAIAFGLSLLMPAFLLTSTVMSENVALPVFVLAAFLIWRTLERPSLAGQVAVLGAIGLSSAIRAEGVILVPIWATTIGLAAALSAERSRTRAVGRALAAYWPSGVAIAAAGGLYLAVTAARGSSVLGFYQPVTRFSYTASKLGVWFGYHLAELCISASFLPPVALLVLLVAAMRGRLDPARTGLVAVALSSAIWLCAVAGAWSSATAISLHGRYTLYAVPLLLLAFVVYLERGWELRRWALAAAVVVCAAPFALPLSRLLTVMVVANAPSIDGLYWLLVHDSLAVARAALAAVALAALAVVVFPRRLASLFAVGLVAGVFVLDTAAGSRLAHNLARSFQAGSLTSSWVDARVGANADVATVWTGAVDLDWLWQVEFWNTSVRHAYVLDEHQAGLGAVPTQLLTVDERSGQILVDGHPLRVGGLVSDRSFKVGGRVLASRPHGVTLVRVAPGAKAQAYASVLYADGWTGPELTFRVPGCTGRRWFGLAFRSSSIEPAQAVVARQAGAIVGRTRAVPGKPVLLRAPVDASKGTCTLRISITPSWSPAERTGSSDTRQLGLVFEKAFRLR